MFLFICCIVWCTVSCSPSPNFVVILTDDQDLLLDSMHFMNKTRKLLVEQGVTLKNFFSNTPICCPSRSTILTGLYPHNHQVFNNSLEGGCSSKQWQQNFESLSFPSILQNAKNYTNFYAGKYLNQYGGEKSGGINHQPQGYDWWIGLKGNSKYYNYTLSINGTGHFFQEDYLTDKIAEFSLLFLNQISSRPFSMVIAPPACHAPFTPAPRHESLFSDVVTIRSVPFNTTPVEKHWIVQMPPTHLPNDVSVLDEIYRNRARTLQSVDELIERVVAKLEEMELLNNTYIVFTSDHGFHIGQFTQPWDKRQPYETDIRIPFVIRGPNIPKNKTRIFPASTVDIAPTILDLANLPFRNYDGKSFKKILFRDEDNFQELVLIEYWGEGNSKSIDLSCPWGQDPELSRIHSILKVHHLLNDVDQK